MIHLDYKDSRPIYEQVADRLKELMILGVLAEDAQMPSVRSLATANHVLYNGIVAAFIDNSACEQCSMQHLHKFARHR